MNRTIRTIAGMTMLVLGLGVSAAADGRPQPRCQEIRGTMVEDLVTEGCNPPHTSCFIGEVKAKKFRATTHFKSDSGADGPTTSPGFRSYSGLFEYRTKHGTLFTRETGVVNTTTGNPESGAVTAYQKIIDANGKLTGATGYFFVSGFSINQHVETIVNGVVCYP
jgi:hypothetical protein